MNFQQLEDRLISHLREKIRNGELTERGLALNVGISQPHIHRVLKGAKALSLENLDLMLKYLNRNLLNFCTQTEIETYYAKVNVSTKPMVEVPLYDSTIGPGCCWAGKLNHLERKAIPCEAIGSCRRPVLARLAPDPGMRHSLQNYNLVLLAKEDRCSIRFASLYAIALGKEALIRRVRRGVNRIYLVSDGSQNTPLQWEAIPLGDRSNCPRIIGRVIWMGTDNLRQPARSASYYRSDEATSSYAAST